MDSLALDYRAEFRAKPLGPILAKAYPGTDRPHGSADDHEERRTQRATEISQYLRTLTDDEQSRVSTQLIDITLLR